ncbi:MAG TPA: elongation factor G, partial [Alphaproteobacteria bacterium]|nr:elongation factor G [Alphaproteobacteria bacterium]
RSLRVLDGLVFLFSAVDGVEPQSETNWRLADNYKVPRIGFVNKMDRQGSNFMAVCQQVKDMLGSNAVPIVMNIGDEADFKGIVDLVKNRAIVWHDETQGSTFDVIDIPEELKAEAAELRAQLIEEVASYDENLLEKFMEDEDSITEEEVHAALRAAVMDMSIIPMICGSAFKNKGVQLLLDAVVDYLPSPIDIPPVKGNLPNSEEEATRKSDDSESFSLLAFKVMNDPFVGSLTFCRVYSGVAETGSTLLNSTRGKRERLGRMLLMHANSREDITEARAGDIVAIAGLKDTYTGDTLCDQNKTIVLEKMDFPDPVIEVAVEPKTKADQEKMSEALQRLAKEDPSFRVSVDHESTQTIIKGMGELHLDIIVDRLKREFQVEANVGAPQVAYRETITKTIDTDYIHKKQSGGAGQFARVVIEFTPLDPGEGFVFDNKIVGGKIPKEYIPGVEKGLKSSKESGVLAGFPVIDFKAVLKDGAFHDVDSSVLAFEIAAKAAFREGISAAGPVLLEPMMSVEVVTPEGYMGDVIGDLNSRRGQVSESEKRANAQVIKAMVPLANMFGYVNNLRSMSQGRASYSMEFDHYQQVPQQVAEEVREKLSG